MRNQSVTRGLFGKEVNDLGSRIDTVTDRFATINALMSESNRLIKE
jgi:hypothetical protein